MAKAPPEAPADKVALYDALIATDSSVERKGAKSAYTSRNGHMFSFLTKTGSLALRLPAEERESFLLEFDTVLCEQHGTVMKEYVVVPDFLLEDTSALRKYFEQSVAYVSSLKPKPTTRKKKEPKKATMRKT